MFVVAELYSISLRTVWALIWVWSSTQWPFVAEDGSLDGDDDDLGWEG